MLPSGAFVNLPPCRRFGRPSAQRRAFCSPLPSSPPWRVAENQANYAEPDASARCSAPSTRCAATTISGRSKVDPLSPAPRAPTPRRCSAPTSSATATCSDGSAAPARAARPTARTSPGEPAACATARSIVSGWMASPGHRANLLRAGLDPDRNRRARAARFRGYRGATVVHRGLRRALGLGHQRAELGQLLAPQLVALAALQPVEQPSHERRQLDGIERLRDVVDAADVEAARAVAELGPRGQEDDRDLGGAARPRAAPRRRPSRRARASSRRAGSRPGLPRAPPRARTARRPPRAPTCPRPRG